MVSEKIVEVESPINVYVCMALLTTYVIFNLTTVYGSLIY